jgi:hypothetical protein
MYGFIAMLSFTRQAERQITTPAQPDSIVRLEVGTADLVVLSTGEKVDNPKPLARDRPQR